MTKFRRLIILSIVLAAGLPISCTEHTPSEQDSRVTFRFRIPGDPPSLDPIHSADLVSQTVVSGLFETLVTIDPQTGEPSPGLARSWEISDSGLSYTFQIDTNARFHNGRPVVAGDVIYSFTRLLDPHSAGKRPWVLTPILGAERFRRGEVDSVEGIAALGDSTVVLRLERPFSPFLAQLSLPVAAIVPREEIERAGEKVFGTRPVGSGPFRFVFWQHDSRVVLERFIGYRKAAPSGAIEVVEYVVVPNVTVAFEKYRAGELDLLDQLPPGQLALCRKRTPEELHLWPGISVRYTGFNLAMEPFAGNLELRRAVNWAVNKAAICEVLGEGVDIASNSPLPPSLPGHNGNLPAFAYNPDSALAALERAGYPHGEGLDEITLLYNNDPVDRRVYEFIQACLGEVGIRVKLKSLEWAAFLAAIRAGESAMFRGSWVGDYPDAHNFLYTLFHSRNWGDAGNYTRYANPEVDSLLERAMTSTDQPERVELYEKAEAIIRHDAPWVFLYHPGQVALLKARWRGALFPAVGVWAIPLERISVTGGGE